MIGYMLLYVSYMYHSCMLGYILLPVVTSIDHLCLILCVYACVLSMVMLVCSSCSCWCIFYVNDYVLPISIGMVDVVTHEV